jgi:hypothetical protein
VAASAFDGSLKFWLMGMPLDAMAKTGADGSYTYWLQGMGLLRNLSATALTPAPYGGDSFPVRSPLQVVTYGSH